MSAAGERFVRTQAIRAAVRGHETAILAGLGIQLNGRIHISCPFPDHDDANPSWRWDEHRARAHCTCANGHALSIFDVIGRMQGLDFDAAKIRAAELIGRADLVEEKGAGGKTKMTAAALLAPPADRSVPDLARIYLAHRLAVGPDQVPMPATPVAGWLNLEYWDPPAEKGAKPHLVGKHSCAVFGTVAPDGRAHAHRIYVQPRGRGKANLEGRDPKKSAPLAKGMNARGCAVIFGDRNRASHLLLAEGIETAAAIALVFKAELDAGQAYVAAAIAEAGVANFEPWPATTRVTVCADRDEAKRESDLGYRAGEKAARRFAKRHQGKLEVAIALPGVPGGKADWLDILLRGGARAVRAGIEAGEAAPVAPEDQGAEAPEDAVAGGSATIYCAGGSLPRSVADAERLLAEATRGDPAHGVYQRGGVLARVARLPVSTVADGIRRAAGSLQILTAGPDFLRLRLTEVATWAKFNKRKGEWVKVDAPADIARTFADVAGLWPYTPSLAGIVQAPTLRPDGTILDAPGYDEPTGLYFDPGATEFPGIPERPTRRDAESARDELLEILDGFPFVDQASKAVALALLITPLIRYAVRAAPLTGISAPKMASGKTLLSHLPAYIATGRAPALMAQADDPQEEKKSLLALLLEGSVVTVLDNCERALRSDILCTALTETVIRNRILGSTRTVSVPTTTTWIATGNNLLIAGDLSSRTLLCTLDPRCERPEDREFAVNLHVDVPTRRGELAAAALTIVQAFLAADAPRQKIPTFGRFEDWSRFVREPLVWLGCADPCETRRAIEAKDPVREKLGNLLEAWHGVFGEQEQTIAAAVKETEPEIVAGMAMPLSEEQQALRNAIEVVGEDRGKLDRRRIGAFLSKNQGRIERGYRADQAGTRSGVTLWSVGYVGYVGSFRRTREISQATCTDAGNSAGGGVRNSWSGLERTHLTHLTHRTGTPSRSLPPPLIAGDGKITNPNAAIAASRS